MVLSTSAAHMSPVVVLLSWISLPDNFPSVRDVTTTRLLDVSSRNEGAFFDVCVLMVFDGGGFGSDYDDNHFDSTFQFRLHLSSGVSSVASLPLVRTGVASGGVAYKRCREQKRRVVADARRLGTPYVT